MISTFCATFSVQPSSRSQRSNHWYFSRQCWTTYAFCLLLGLAGCNCAVLQELNSNITLPIDSSCLVDSVPGGYYGLYPVDVFGCWSEDVDGFLNVEILVTNLTHEDDPLFSGTFFWLVADSREKLPVLNISRNDSQPGTTFATVDDEDPDYLNHSLLTLSLREYDGKLPWYASVSAWTEDVNFILRAWCTGSEGCAENCQEDSHRCVGRGTCNCFIGPNNTVCERDVTSLESKFGVQDLEAFELVTTIENTVPSGEWNYFSFEAHEKNACILVEMSRKQGDIALFLKPRDVNTSLAVPSGSDFEAYSDKSGFQNRLKNHFRYHSGAGSFIIGVFNNDACVKEQVDYTLAVTVASSDTAWNLCPLNCSFPQGTCIEDAVCVCQDGFAGPFCDASVSSAELFEAFGDTLLPGDIVYYQICLEDVVGTNSLSIEFYHEGGHPILMLGEGRDYPTLVDNYLKTVEGPLEGNVSNVYSVDNVRRENETVILAVFNADYAVRGESSFTLLVLLIESENAKNALKPTLIIMVGFLSSLFACVAMGMVKCMINRCHGVEAIERFDQTAIEGVEDASVAIQGLSRNVVESFPLITFEEDLKQNETQCPICLSDYKISDKLRVIPPCTHTFHVACVDVWLRDHANCPVCRVLLQPGSIHESSSPPMNEMLPIESRT